MASLDKLKRTREELEFHIEATEENMFWWYNEKGVEWTQDFIKRCKDDLKSVNNSIAEEEERIAAANAARYVPRIRRDDDYDYEDDRRRRFQAEHYRQEQNARNHERYHQREHTSHDQRCPYERGY